MLAKYEYERTNHPAINQWNTIGITVNNIATLNIKRCDIVYHVDVSEVYISYVKVC